MSPSGEMKCLGDLQREVSFIQVLKDKENRDFLFWKDGEME